MNKPLVIGAMITGTLGLGWLGTTWYSSQQVQNYYQQYVNQFNLNTLSPVSIKLTSFKQDFLHSRANWEISLTLDPCQPNNTTVLTGYDEITHGVVPSLGWAKVDTHIIWPDAIEPTLQRVFAGQEPLKIQSWVALSGSVKTKLQSPAASWQSARYKVEWQGLQGSMQYQHQSNQTAFDIEIPRIAIQSIASNADNLILQHLSYRGQQLANRALLPIGESRLQIKQVQGTLAQQQLSLQGIRIDHRNRLKQAWLTADSQYQIKKIVLNQENIGQFKARFTLDKINEQALQQSYIAFNRIQQQCHPSAQQFVQAFAPVTQQGFDMALTDTELELFKGKAIAKGQLKLAPSQRLNAQNWTNRLQLQASFDVSQQLLSGSLVQMNQLKGQPISTGEASSTIQMLLQGMLEQGYLQQTGTSYQTSLSMNKGEFWVNNLPFNRTITQSVTP